MNFGTLDITAKIHNGGNSFVVKLIDNFVISKNSIQSLCSNLDGSSTDGLVLINNTGNDNWQLRFFNADGSPFKMCFNGTFCAAKYLKTFLGINGEIRFVTSIGDITADAKKDVTLNFYFQEPIISHLELPLKPSWRAYFVRMTDNHVVVFSDKNYFDEPDFIDEAKKIRHAEEFLPEGTNVHFASTMSNSVLIRHFEKGIEKETLSCGSGCLATAFILQEKYLDFISRGGEIILKNKGKHAWAMSSLPKLLL